MSYILDALKKVERERARVRHPLVEVSGAPPASRRRLWPWAVAGALVLNAAVAGLVALRWPSGPAAEPPRTVATAPEAPSAPSPPAVTSPAAPGPTTPTEPTAPARPERAAAVLAEPVQPAPPPRRTETRTVPPVDTVAPPGPAPSPPAPPPITTPGVSREPAAPPPAPAPAVAAARPPERTGAGAISDLPPAFQSAVDGLKLEVLLYGATAADRMVFINGRKYVEGQRIDGELVVERITTEGAVLAHGGRHFLLTPSR